MNLVFIYGPPATGKYTVGKELAKLTGYKLFHNHVTVDMVLSVFDRDSKEYQILVDKCRLEMFEKAAKYGISLIFTFVYAERTGDPFIKETLRIVKRYNGKVLFVRLRTSRKEIYKRLKGDSRKKFTKMRTKKEFDSLIDEHALFSKVPFVRSLDINNTNLPPIKAADKIVKHYKLERGSKK